MMAGTMLRTAENEAFAETLAGDIDQCSHICSGRHEPGTCVIRSGKATLSAMKTLSKLRSGKAKFAVPLLLMYTLGSAMAATKGCPSGTLAPNPATTTGPTTDVIIARAAPALAVQATSPAGTATVAVEMSCDGANWAPVTTALSLAAATPSGVVLIQNPPCTYRANVTACSGCSVTVGYSCAGP